jgi:hypothetical protein
VSRRGKEKFVTQKVRDADTLRFGQKGDVEGAHRLVKVARKDWGSQSFELAGAFYVNTGGHSGDRLAGTMVEQIGGRPCPHGTRHNSAIKALAINLCGRLRVDRAWAGLRSTIDFAVFFLVKNGSSFLLEKISLETSPTSGWASGRTGKDSWSGSRKSAPYGWRTGARRSWITPQS